MLISIIVSEESSESLVALDVSFGGRFGLRRQRHIAEALMRSLKIVMRFRIL
jgi:hypothetical protein